MHTFVRNAPLDLTARPEPAVSDRSGPPLSQGFLFTLIGMVASDLCSEATLETITQADPDLWYPGQALESVLDEVGRKSPRGAFRVGHSVYFMLPDKLREIGIVDAASFFRILPSLWQNVTRGDSGHFETQMLGDKMARVDMVQPYNCEFEEGALVGFLEGLGHREVTTQHTTCMRLGEPACKILISWK